MRHRRHRTGSRGAVRPPGGNGARAALALAVLLVAAVAVRAQPLQNPRRAAEGPPGQVLVTDRSGAIVAVSKATLEPLWSFALPDEGAPFGLASWNRLLFVGNTVTGNVEVYRMTGPPTDRMTLRFEYHLGHPPAGESGPFENPVSLGIDRKSHQVFVLDARAKRVKIFDLKGTFLGEFAPVDGAGVLLSPVSLEVDEARREVLVSDFGDPSGFFRVRKPARILIYDFQGNLLFQIDGNASTHDSTQFTRVQGMAVASDGRIFVADALGGRVLVLDRATGEKLGEIGTQGPDPGQLMLPLDVLLDEKSGDLFVTNNRGGRRLEAFRGAGR